MAQAEVLPEVVGPLRAPCDHGGKKHFERFARRGAAFEQFEQAGFAGIAFDAFAQTEQAPSGGFWEKLLDKRADCTPERPAEAVWRGAPVPASAEDTARIEATTCASKA